MTEAEPAAVVEVRDVVDLLVVQCGACETDIEQYGYVPLEVAEELQGERHLAKVRATRDVVARGLIFCPSCATRHRAGGLHEGVSGPGNNPCRTCGHFAELYFGQLQTCLHQRVDATGRVVRT